MLDGTVGNASVLTRRLLRWSFPLLVSTRHLPSRTLSLFFRHIHFTLPLLIFLLLFAAVHAAILISLVRDFPAAFPHARTLYVSALVTVPTWGFAMCALHLLSTARTPLSSYLGSRARGERWRHAPLRDTYNLEAASEHDSKYRSSHYATVSAAHDDQDRPPPKRTRLWLGYLTLGLLGFYMLCTYALPGDHRFTGVVDLARRQPRREGYGNGEKIFIAAMFYNNAAVLPYWTREVTKLIHYLGPDNVFVSILESYSTDATPALLRQFSRTLNTLEVPQRILIQDTAIRRPKSMDTASPRIEYLAALRNRVLEPLVEGGGYDRVLFSNDVFVEAESFVELLNTRDGDYDMACGLDFQQWGLYDIWTIRDRLGQIPSTVWPYFFDDNGLRAVMSDEPAPMFTCWNGIVSIRAAPFLPSGLRPTNASYALSTSPLEHPLPATHPASVLTQTQNLTPATSPALRFRASALALGECFSSESFNLPYDLRRQFALEKIYVNPRVLTAYVWRYYLWFKYVTRHWAVKWFIERVENGSGMHLARFVLGEPEGIWLWDGGECHPGPWHKEGETAA